MSRLGFRRDKGLDLVARFNGRYVIGEAKFLTDYGGYQDRQFEDAITTLESDVSGDQYVVKVAILDGVLYIPSENRMHRTLKDYSRNNPILSALLLRDFLYAL